MQPRQRGPSAKRGTVASGTSSRTGSNKRPVSGGKRGASGGLRRSGSAGKRRQSTMPGSSRSAEKKPPPIKAKLQRMRMNGLELLDRGDTREGLKELNRSLQQRVMNAAKLGKFAEPLWEYAEEVTLIANNEAVFRDAAAEPSEEVQIFFKEAMRYISVKEDEVGARSSPGSSSARRRQSSSIATPAWKKADYFADFPALKGMLRSVVLNNLAVHQRSISQVSAPTSSSAAYPDQAATLASLMNALKHSSGNMCTGILYNMAVIFTGAGRFDDAVEAIARCVELGSLYLKCKAPPLPGTTHNNNNTNTNTNTPTSPQAPSGAASASSAAAASPAAATAEEAAAAAAEVRAWLAYNTLISMVASHLVMAHHLVATIAEWCGLPEEELYHCKLALGCAQKYLPKHHPMHKRCANRLAAPQHRPAPAEASEVVPPQLQLLAQGELVAAPCALFELSELTPFANAAAAAGRLPALPLSALLAICSTVTLPRDLRAYLRSVDGILAKEQQRGGGGGVSLPPIISAGGRRSTVSLAGGDKRRSIMTEEGSSLRTGSGQATSGSTWREGTPAQHGQDNNNNNNNNKDDDGADHRSCVVTKIPRPAFERYQQLNKETVGYLKMSNASTNNNNNNMNDGLAPDASGSIFSGTGRLPPLHSAGTSPRPFMNDRRRSSLYVAPAEATNSSTTNPHMMSGGTTDNNNNASPIITAADGHTASPSHFMRGMDRDLLRFSKVQRDKIREIQEPAAIKIQRMWRCHLMRKIVRAKQAAVQEWLDKMDAAMMLYHAYLLWKERQPAVAELQRLKDERERQRKITLIQRYLREKQSVEEWGRKCAELHERLLLAKLQREKEIAAATMIQTCWRRHDAQQQLKKAIYAATRIENAWRCRQARRELMIRRVHQRLRYEAFLRSAMPQIIYIQTWWRACMARRAVADELPRRKKAIEDYLRAMEDFFNTQLGHLSEVPNVERCIQKVMGVLRGARDRAEMRATHAKWLIVRRLIFQRVLMHRGAHELEALREKHAIERAIQRRREEVLLACERLQSAARMWAAKKEARRRRALVAHRHHAALVVQRAFRRFKDRSFLAALRAKQGMAEEIAKMGQVRQYCATKIQATWRMHRVRTANASYLRFMAMDRHAYATRAQQAWRAYRARREAAQRGAVVREYRKDRQQHERRAVAAVKMQSVARMYLCRRRLQDEDGISLAESPFKLFFAARAIQTAWRAMAARRYVHQAMLARAYFHHERCATEALNAYAIIIQRAVRQHLLAAPSSASSSSPKNAVVVEEEEEKIDVRGLPVDELDPSLAPLCDCLESVAAELPGISLRYHEEVLQQSANGDGEDDDAQQPCVRYSWTVMMVDDAEGEVLGEANGKHEDRVEALCVALTIAAEVLLTIRVDESEGGTASRQDGLTEEGSNMNRDDEDDATAMTDNEEEQQQEEQEEEEEEVPGDDDVDAMPPSNMKQSPSEQLQADALYYNSERDSSHAEPTSRQSFGGTQQQQQQQQQQDDAMVADDSRQLNSADGTTESERLREMAAYYNSDDEASRRESLRQTQLNGTTDSAQLREAATFYRSEYESEGQTPSMRTTIHADFDGTTDSQGLRNAAAYYNEEYRPESQGS